MRDYTWEKVFSPCPEHKGHDPVFSVRDCMTCRDQTLAAFREFAVRQAASMAKTRWYVIPGGWSKH